MVTFVRAAVVAVGALTFLASCSVTSPEIRVTVTPDVHNPYPSSSVMGRETPSSGPSVTSPLVGSGESERLFVFGGEFMEEDAPGAPVNPDGTYGSGCTPPKGDGLPDGIWLVYVDSSSDAEWTVDLVCMYSPDSAHARSAAASCAAEYPDRPDRCQWAGEYENSNPNLRTIPVASDLLYFPTLNGHGGAIQAVQDTDEWFWVREVWIYINDGQITQAHERYTP